ncbi:MAG: GNAT family N-acetyltransferase [Pseudomonadota bacterium]
MTAQLVDLPPGKIASVVTYMEQRRPPGGKPARLPDGASLAQVTAVDPARYRALFRLVGGPWLWFSRLALDDAALLGVLHHPQVALYILRVDDMDAGFVELDARHEAQVELAFLGVAPELVGRGYGRPMIAFALQEAWARRPARVFVHSCTLDHPGALAFYRKAGFVAYARKVEIADDPRLGGLLPQDAAPHVPLIAPPRGEGALPDTPHT